MPDTDALADALPDPELRALLSGIRVIAVVGFSPDPARPSHYVSRFLQARGYTVLPVNPEIAGEAFLGTRVRATVSEIEGSVDMVDIFRRPEAILGTVDEALAALPGLTAIWMQLGLRHAEAATRARQAGVTVIQNRCPRIEIPRLFGPDWRVA